MLSDERTSVLFVVGAFAAGIAVGYCFGDANGFRRCRASMKQSPPIQTHRTPVFSSTENQIDFTWHSNERIEI